LHAPGRHQSLGDPRRLVVWKVGLARRVDILPSHLSLTAGLGRALTILRLARTVLVSGGSGLLAAPAVFRLSFSLLGLSSLMLSLAFNSLTLFSLRAGLSLSRIPRLHAACGLLRLGRLALHPGLPYLLALASVLALSGFGARWRAFGLSLRAGLARALAHLALTSFAPLAATGACRRLLLHLLLLALLGLLRKGDWNYKSGREGRRGGASPYPLHDLLPEPVSLGFCLDFGPTFSLDKGSSVAADTRLRIAGCAAGIL
jgi:hypothetical protein